VPLPQPRPSVLEEHGAAAAGRDCVVVHRCVGSVRPNRVRGRFRPRRQNLNSRALRHSRLEPPQATPDARTLGLGSAPARRDLTCLARTAD
jgi:hypothetical protein